MTLNIGQAAAASFFLAFLSFFLRHSGQTVSFPGVTSPGSGISTTQGLTTAWG